MSSLQYRAVARDPGLKRLKLAARTTITVASVAWLLFHLGAIYGQPPTGAFIGVVIAMIGSMAVNDSSTAQRKVTTLLLPLPAALGVLAATGLAQWHFVSIAGFVAATYISVAARRHGPRPIAFAVTGFMAYFCALFFKAGVSAVPWMIIAIVITAGAMYGVRFWALPDRPERQLRWALAAYRARMACFLETVARAATRERRTALQRRRILRRMSDINETALDLEDLIRSRDFAHAADERRFRLERQIFELELALSGVGEAALRLTRTPDLPADLRRRIITLLKEAKTCLSSPHGATRLKSLAASLAEQTRDLAPFAEAVADLAGALDSFAASSDLSGLDVAETIDSRPPESLPEVSVAAPKGLHPSTRQAIQAALAVGLASIFGGIVAPANWAWAAIAAYVAFNGSTRGDTVRRAVQRTMGTTIGIVTGLGLASLFSDPSTELTLIFVCIFAGVYMAQVGYGWTTMWFTVMVAVLYKMMGRLTQEILVLRLEETLVGVGFAALVALFVLPAPTRGSIGRSLVKLLRHLAGAYETWAEVGGTAKRADAAARVRSIDRELRALRQAAVPMLSSLVTIRSREVDGLVHDVSAIVHYTRTILRADILDEGMGHELRARYKTIATRTHELANQVERRIELTGRPIITFVMTSGPVSCQASGVSSEQLWLARIEQLLEILRQRLGFDAGSA